MVAGSARGRSAGAVLPRPLVTLDSSESRTSRRHDLNDLSERPDSADIVRLFRGRSPPMKHFPKLGKRNSRQYVSARGLESSWATTSLPNFRSSLLIRNTCGNVTRPERVRSGSNVLPASSQVSASVDADGRSNKKDMSSPAEFCRLAIAHSERLRIWPQQDGHPFCPRMF